MYLTKTSPRFTLKPTGRVNYLGAFFACFFGVNGAGGVASILRKVSSALRRSASLTGGSLSGLRGAVIGFPRG